MKIHNIKFIDYDGKVIKKIDIEDGKKIKAPKPKRYFYKFEGWRPKFNEIARKDMVYKAKYKPKRDYDNNGISDEEEFLKIVSPILNNEEFLKRKKFKHHGKTSLYEHSFAVSYYAYIWAKKLHFKQKTVKNVAIAGMLHDFYYEDWTKIKDNRPFFKKHGFVHAKEAKENSKKYFKEYMNNRILNAIERHMFPLNITPPKYKEGWIITLADKYVSMDVIKDYKILYSFFSRKHR